MKFKKMFHCPQCDNKSWIEFNVKFIGVPEGVKPIGSD